MLTAAESATSSSGVAVIAATHARKPSSTACQSITPPPVALVDADFDLVRDGVAQLACVDQRLRRPLRAMV
jgi:hypothetical protein